MNNIKKYAAFLGIFIIMVFSFTAQVLFLVKLDNSILVLNIFVRVLFILTIHVYVYLIEKAELMHRNLAILYVGLAVFAGIGTLYYIATYTNMLTNFI